MKACIAAICGMVLLTNSTLCAQKVGWRHEMKMVDYMGIYDFPEELVGFPFTCPANAVRKEHLKLEREGAESPVEYQLSNVVESRGYLTSATVHFRSDLPRNSAKLFSLVYDPAYTAEFTPRVTFKTNSDGTAVIGANLQQLRVPADGAAASTKPAPILGISRDGGRTWIGGGAMLLPPGITLTSVRGTIVDQGTLFIKYRLFYIFNSNRTWQVDLTVQHNEKHVLVDELLSGFGPGEAAIWKLSYKKGLEPDARLVLCNGGYNAGPRGQYCGAYDLDLRADGALPYQLGLYTANSYGVMRSTVFFKDNGQNALIFAINRPRDWKTAARRVWSGISAPENLYFCQREGDAYARLSLVGRERHWALGLIPRDELVISELPVTPSDQTRAQQKKPPRRYAVRKGLEGYAGESRGQFGAGPEVRLWQKLTDFSLNAYKDMVFDFDEPLTPYDPQGEKCSYDDYWMGSGFGNLRGYMYKLIQRYWDASGDLQSAFGKRFEPYANSRADWTAEQRRHIRSILIFAANFLVEDSFSPHVSMMAGQPNFVFDAKGSIPVACVTFPKHPHAERWKNEFARFWGEWLDVYTRRANPRLNTYGGRWTENIACYWMASLMRSFYPAEAMRSQYNTEIYAHPLFKDLIRWTFDGLAPSEEPCRRLVPIGAHARGEVEGERLRYASEMLTKSDPTLAQQLLWCYTDGAEGTKPDLQSRLYTDYGAVMWYDPDGPHEAFLTIQQLNGSGYRWTGKSNGALYYATKGQRWSWNGAEQNGDRFDINLIPLFNLDGESLGAHEVDGLLYDFDFAQFYKASGANPAYPWRGVMMLRDDYLAVYDHVTDPKAIGKFQWCNYEANLRAHYFANPDFTDLKKTYVPRQRLPLTWDWGNEAPLESMKPGPFSIRWTGMFLPETTGEYSILADVNAGDSARIWLNNQLAYDIAAGKPVPVRLVGNQLIDVKVEFIHRTGPARISVKWGTDKLVPPNTNNAFNRLVMPQLYPVKADAGDQLHIVAPKAHKVETTSYGAVIDGKEYVFCSDSEVKATDGPAVFIGRAGYARENQVAIFEGTKVGFNGLAVERVGGEFGISAAKQADGTLAGRIVGRSGGTIKLTPPVGFDVSRCQVKVDGVVVPHNLVGGAIRFDVQISQSDGPKSYTISAGRSGATTKLTLPIGIAYQPSVKSEPWPVPIESKTYVPKFSTVKTELGYYWVLDHGKKIALLRRSMIGLFRQLPGQAMDEKVVSDAQNRNIWSDVPGLRLWAQFMITTNMYPNKYLQDVQGELSLDSSDPEQLTIRQSWRKSASEFGTQVVRIDYDRDLARYVMHVEADLQINQPGGGEYCNFYAQGLGDFRPGVNRYDRLLYQDADDSDKLKAHYLSVQKPQPGPIHLPPNGLVGFVDEKDGNPVIIVEESTPRTRVDMCLCWFDAHLIWDEVYHVDRSQWPKTRFSCEPAVPGPPYCYHVKYKAYWINAAETSSLLAKAQTVSLEPYADSFKNYLPIDMNVVNNFEHTADVLAGKVKHIYFPLKALNPRKPSSGIAYDTTIGRSGQSSIRFVSVTDEGIGQVLTGPELMVTPGRQVKIFAWVKTSNVTGEGFYLESGFQRGGEQLGPKYCSAKLTGTNDWTLLEIPLPVTPTRTQFLGKGRITFRLNGQGTAWVDDFVFAERDPGARR